MSDVVSLPSKDPATPLKLLATLCWTDPAERTLAQASFAAATIIAGERRAKSAIVAGASDRALEISDMIPPLLRNPAKTETHHIPPGMLRQYANAALAITNGFRDGLFESSGGLQAVVHAPSEEQLIKRIAEVVRGGAVSAALQLIMVARMERFPNKDLTPSLTRARSLLEYSKRGVNGFGTKRWQTTAFVQWGCVAPLWAGVMIAGGYPWSVKDRYFEQAVLEEGLFSVLYDQDRTSTALSFALTLTNFATTFIPPKAREPLLTPSEVVRFDTDVTAADLPLSPLSPEERLAAKKAKTKEDRLDYQKG
ncbi:hypothetical protein [Salinarimonas ramus]|uniref:Uncharacterized protein n=1 Tax=Salinarimonas ramus TaxID=690164 RepID=A0A917QLY9_9HYPH|nr:hypothetical protein [Salinarimonas ramus]GGK55713.1 hypothetical protein GCM10011322_47960 [Salinarimonas ramus]